MYRHRARIVLTLALSMACGCRGTSVAQRVNPAQRMENARVVNSEIDREVSSTAKISAENTESQAEIRQVAASDRDGVTTDPASDSLAAPSYVNSLSIRQAIETALTQNPDLLALRQGEEVGVATLGVARTYPFNPYLQVRATPYQRGVDGSTGSTYHYILLMQQIQLAHQQQHREEAACAALNSIRWNVLQAELLNVAQTERLYFAAIYQKGLLDLANLNAENNRQLLGILQSQYEAGQATASDVAIVKLDVRSTRQQQKIAEANLQTALLDLKRQLGFEPNVPIELDDEVRRWTWRPVESTQLAQLSSGRPDVMAARSDVDTARANTNFANASRVPDVQLGPFYQRDDFGVTYLGFQGHMDLPVNNTGVPLLRQREAEFNQRAITSQQLVTRARLEAEAAANRYERARSLMAESDGSSNVALPAELQRLEEQFKAGEVDILRVMQARNSLLQSQRADLDTLNELMLAAVAVTASTGCPLESLIVPLVLEPERTLSE
jgi:cobalt-zinc-cadmium efflux system outer membrane protein